ncbi:MAG: ribosome maturation factor RimP [Candidatus Nanopelagicales bacterium]
MSAPSTDRLFEMFVSVVEKHGLELDEVHLSPAGRRRMLRVVVDKDGGVTLDDIAMVSHSVSRVLDDTDVMGGTAYTLEVTSPGVDRPLTEPRHWRRAAGRLVKVRLVNGREMTGRVLAANPDAIELDAGEGGTRLPYAAVRDGRVQVEFSRPGSQPDGEEGEPWIST